MKTVKFLAFIEAPSGLHVEQRYRGDGSDILTLAGISMGASVRFSRQRITLKTAQAGRTVRHGFHSNEYVHKRGIRMGVYVADPFSR